MNLRFFPTKIQLNCAQINCNLIFYTLTFFLRKFYCIAFSSFIFLWAKFCISFIFWSFYQINQTPTKFLSKSYFLLLIFYKINHFFLTKINIQIYWIIFWFRFCIPLFFLLRETISTFQNSYFFVEWYL